LAARRKASMKKCSRVVAAVIAIMGFLGTSQRAAAEDRLAVVVTVAAPIYLLPDTTRTPLRILELREYVRVRKNDGGWLRVDFQDPQFGLRTGYIQTKLVQLVPIEHDGQSELVTVDLGLRAPVPRNATTPSATAAPRERNNGKPKN
jgi:hypothetical protein